MKKRIHLTLVAAVTTFAVFMFAVVFSRAVGITPIALEYLTPPKPSVVTEETYGSAEKPVRLVIPSLHIDALVQPVGVNTKGNMGVPSNFTDVAWYREGVIPGQKGSAVINGHVDNGLGLPGVFKKLSTLSIGDEVSVETQEGSILRFMVEKVERYPYREVPVEQIFNSNDTARLNLITCDGTWLPEEKTYNQRLVVYARLLPTKSDTGV